MITVFFICLLIVFILARPKFHLYMQSDQHWLSRERTSFVNSFFILLVFISHIRQYDLEVSPIDTNLLQHLIPNQLIVTTFFFFSGYGLMYSIQSKGRTYVQRIICQRFPQLLMNFSIAVLLYVALQACLGRTYSFGHILLSLPGWESVGNSNWFICITLLAYLFIYASFSIAGTRHPYAAALLVAVLLSFSTPLILLEKGTYWVDTYLCIPAGMLFAHVKEWLEEYLPRIPVPTLAIGLLCGAGGYCMHMYTDRLIGFFGLYGTIPPLPVAMAGSVLFALGLTLAYSCIAFRSLPQFMIWLGGAALFPMYIFQRIPMILGHHWGLNGSHTDLYVAVCLIASILLAACFQRIYAWMGRRAFPS